MTDQSRTQDKMCPEALLAWRASMGFTHQKAAAALGVGLRTYHRWEKEGADRAVALACAALYHRLGPWAHVSPRPRA